MDVFGGRGHGAQCQTPALLSWKALGVWSGEGLGVRWLEKALVCGGWGMRGVGEWSSSPVPGGLPQRGRRPWFNLTGVEEIVGRYEKMA